MRGQAVAVFKVTTGADSEEGLRDIVEDLRAKNPDQEGLAVFFKPKDGDLLGEGYAFDDAGTEAAFMKRIDANRAQWEAAKDGHTTIMLE
jgi:hypothetical protein